MKYIIHSYIFIILFSTIQANSQVGYLDPTFGNDGIMKTDTIGGPAGLSILNDGKILVGGAGEHFFLNRFNDNGSFDESFGKGGRVNINLNGKYASCKSMAVQNDSKVLLVGTIDAANTYNDAVIVRCKSNGSLDSSFGINGIKTINFSNYDYAYDVAIQPDGKIIVIGDFTKNLNDFFDSYILRLNANGSLDLDFGNGGITKVHYSLSIRNRAISIQADGKFLMAGTYAKFEAQPDYIVERFNIDGTVDNSFGENGTAKFNFGEGQSGDWDSELFDMALQSDGKIVCAGQSGHHSSMSLCRFNTDGTIDNAFGESGSVITEYKNNLESYFESISIQKDNKVLATGGAENCNTLLVRYEKDGQLDLGFAENGIQSINFSGCSVGQYVVPLPDNKILVAGYNNGFIFLTRFNGDNVLAANFKEVKAMQENEAITITWQTLNESNTKSYTIERSNNAKEYVGINTIPAKHAATNSYSYTDKNPLYGDNYYRIKENAANGTNTYSQTLKVVFENNGNISLYPNPAKNTVTIKGLDKNATTVIKITDMNGREIIRRGGQSFSNTSSATISIRALAQGSYFILVEQNGKVTKLRMVKE